MSTDSGIGICRNTLELLLSEQTIIYNYGIDKV